MNTFQCDYKEPNEETDICMEFPKRILRNDIVYLRIHYTDNEYEDIYVPWVDSETNASKNSLQKVTKDDEGNYIIEIDRK